MALGKITIVIGAGIVGSILSKEGNLSTITDIFSGALKIVTKHIQQDKGGPRSTATPHTNSLLDQVNNLRQELQLLASSRPVTIVTGSQSGSGTHRLTAAVVVGAIGYGYIRWKGWKLSDVMFVTRRGLSDACTTVGKQLEQVSSSITAAKKFLSSRIDRVDCRLDECRELTAATKDEVTAMHGSLNDFQENIRSVSLVVQDLETKLDRIEGSQELTTRGIYALCQFANRLEQNQNIETIQASPSSSSRKAIEPSRSLQVTRTVSLPPLALESPSPSASPSPAVETPKVLRSTTISDSGLKELQGVSNGMARLNSWKAPVAELPNTASPSSGPSNGSASAVRFGFKIPGISTFTRARGAAS